MRLCVAALALFVALSDGFAVQRRQVLRPVDEAVSRPDFLAFRTQLIAAVARRDASAILNIVDPSIKNSFGGDDGIDEFKRMWRLEESNRFWNEFGNVLRLGGSFDNANEFTAPYTFSRWPNNIDSFDYVAVVGTRVRMRTLPRLNAPVGGQVSHEILRLDMEAFSKDWRTEEWTAVRINGRKMYIATRFIRSPIDYRAHFQYIDGRWWLNFFLAGD